MTDQKPKIKLIQLVDKDSNKVQPYILQLDLVGKGFYGSVYKAVHQHNPNMVFAVKVINLQRPESRQQILKQLQIIQNIPKSPNLVDTHKQHLQSQKHLYIFQEYCEGGSLADFKQRNEGRLLREHEVYDLFFQLAKGYIDLYHAGIIHEDIKPSNILIKGKLYKYCDFGVSQLASKLKQEESRKGTVSYMPPQKLSSKFMPNAKSDIYSLGVTLYEVVFGYHPYLSKKTKNTKEYLGTLNMAQLRPQHQLMRRVYSPSVKFYNFLNILQKMIALKPQKRLSIEQLIKIISNDQIFKDMKLPTQQKSSSETDLLSPTTNRYATLPSKQSYAQSRIFMCGQQNRLVNQEEFKVELEMEHKAVVSKREEELRISKILEEEESKMLQGLFKQYKVIQAVVGYVAEGCRVVRYAFEAVEEDTVCKGEYFAEEELPFLGAKLFQEPVCEVLKFFVLKLNLSLMVTFSKSVQNEDKFFSQVPIWEEIQYLQAQISKFIADKNLQNMQSKKLLINMTSNWTVDETCQLLTKQFSKLFNCLVFQNQVRINFKKDLLSAIFLLHAKQVLQRVRSLTGICSQENRMACEASQKDNLSQMDKITSWFNVYKTMHLAALKEQFYGEFKDVEGLIFSAEENTDSFVDIDELLKEDEEPTKAQQCTIIDIDDHSIDQPHQSQQPQQSPQKAQSYIDTNISPNYCP